MSDELDYKTFDLAAVLAGIDYPEDTVEVYFDDKLGYTINKLHDAVRDADLRGNHETAVSLQKDLDDLSQKVTDARYVVHLRGIPKEVKEAVIAQVDTTFPPERDLLGQIKSNPSADSLLTQLLWAKYITKVEDPSGAVSLMTEALAAKLLGRAPESAQKKIALAIRDLTEGSVAGFEYASRQVDFLLTASPEG